MSSKAEAAGERIETPIASPSEHRMEEVFRRYCHLIEQQDLRGLKMDEQAEMEALGQEIDRFPDDLYEPILAELVTLVNRDRVEEARSLVQVLARRWPEVERVRHLQEVLAPPVARLRPDLDLRVHEREREWLRQNARDYPGCWLAVLEDRLIAADPDLDVVLAAVHQTPGGECALLDFQVGRAD